MNDKYYQWFDQGIVRSVSGCLKVYLWMQHTNPQKSIHLLLTKRPQYHKAETEINAHLFCFRSVFVLLLCNLGQVTRSLS